MNFPTFKLLKTSFESTWIIIKMEIRTIEIYIKKKFFKRANKKNQQVAFVLGLKCISKKKKFLLRY